MPYGTLASKYIDTPTSVTSQKVGNSPYTYTTGANTIVIERRQRSGTNSAKGVVRGAKQKKSPIGYRTVVYYVRQPNSEKKSVRFISKSTGKPYWIRPKWIKVQVTKRKPIFSKSVKKGRKSLPRGLDLPANNLSYSEVYVIYSPLDSVSNGLWTCTGRLTNQFKLSSLSSTYYGFHPQNDVGTSRGQQASQIAASLDASCYTEFLNRIKDSRVNLAQAFAERHETARTIIDLAIKATRAIVALKHGHLTQAAEALFPKGSFRNGVADYWLCYQYGVRPLLMDIRGAMEAMAKDQDIQFDVIRSKTQAIPFQQKHDQMDSYGTIKSNLYCSWDTFIKGSVTVKYKASVYVANPGLQALSSLGLLNLESLAWELIPYSFVIDWVLPVGDYLSGLDALTGISVLRAHKTIYSKETITCVKSFNGSAGGYSSSGTCGRTTRRVCVDRTRLMSLPPPPLPNFSLNRINLKKVLSGLALLNQLK